jgi:hypothetical protein
MVPMATGARERTRSLLLPALALLGAVILHDLDHLRQGRSIEGPVIGIGVIGDIAVITLVALAIRGSRWAPHAAVLVGFANFFGFIAVHVLPDWGPLSDGYPKLGVDTLSWIAVALPMAAGAVAGSVGLSILRRRRALASA